MTDAFARTLKMWPTPPITPIDKLLHTIDVYDPSVGGPADDEMAITATTNLYGDVRTGLTWGALRTIAATLADTQNTQEQQ